jgi:hypothetical protein
VCVRYRGNVSIEQLLATIGGFYRTEPLPSNDRGIHVQTHRLMGGIFFNQAVEMDSGAVIYIPSFIKIGSGVQKLIGGIHRHTQTHGQQRDLISLLYFFKIRKVG